MSTISTVLVAIPVRNEETLLPESLDSVERAAQTLLRVHPDVQILVVVALDGCTDGSAAIAAAHGVETVHVSGVGVGPSRDAAILRGIDRLGSPDESRTWLACTDADTTVPATWLVRQLIWADSGMDLVMGTVEPVGVEDPGVLAAWHSRHRLVEGHPYVHGANLGVRACCWRRAGGFGARAVHEDRALVTKVRECTDRWVATDTTRVATSGRLIGRAESGFADYLDALSVPR